MEQLYKYVNDPEMLKEWILDGVKIIAANYWLNAAIEFGSKVLEEYRYVAAVRSTCKD